MKPALRYPCSVNGQDRLGVFGMQRPRDAFGVGDRL
jgi:hypothetical protein